jgi:hypothetical protein
LDYSSDSPPKSAWLAGAWAAIAAFGTYFCMYGFRKPFAAAEYNGFRFAGMDYKTVLVAAQVLGYMVAKFIGIKVISETAPRQRAVRILFVIAIAEAALVFFGLTPRPFDAIFLFVNGLALGMVFGLVFGFLEGRKETEALAAVLCASFIVGDGFSKSIGATLLREGVREVWMPAVAGALFVLPLLVFVWMLTRIPPPSASDVVARSERTTMTAADRRQFFRRYALGLSLLIMMYLLVTILRSMRADFAPEIWRGLGFTGIPGIYAQSELLDAVGVLSATGSSILIRDNRLAFLAALGLCFVGLLLAIVALLCLSNGIIGGFEFMVLIGLALYLPYVSVQTTIFERFIALTRDRANIAFLLYLADSFGYLGYVGVMFARNIWDAGGSFLSFFVMICWGLGLAALVCMAWCMLHFLRLTAPQRRG